MNVVDFKNGVLAFEPEGKDERISSVTPSDLQKAGWSEDFVKAITITKRSETNLSEK